MHASPKRPPQPTTGGAVSKTDASTVAALIKLQNPDGSMPLSDPLLNIVKVRAPASPVA